MKFDTVKENEVVIIFGGTGFLGQLLNRFLKYKGYTVWTISRDKQNNSDFEWDPYLKKFPVEILAKTDHIINLSGANLMKRWTENYKRQLVESRVISTRFIRELIEQNRHEIKSVINASGISIYGDRPNTLLTENDKPGTGFLEKLCVNWESEAREIRKLGVRTNILRISPVVHYDNPFIKTQFMAARLRLLAPLGLGTQYVPWVHYTDLLNIIHFLMTIPSCNSTYNVCSPNPIQQREMNKIIGDHIGKNQFAWSIPKQIIKLILGAKSQLLTDSIKTTPKRLIEAGYNFKYQNFSQALKHL
ncbi:TIGR01777 family oxidoreductase [Ichthyobacterium seriolicida]|uniref:Cell division inhibitor n=1 Tax=Ichthyobacterium seriolicida TaxID=242600 RepID=A0A1J1E9V4_9FLAO|nr:TIGR01777 family oxidoreductase [Ichthyobacterium seriolicida]BAV94699.1 cell division inhibitor [Ichthyobacterium seriolicida]